MFYKRVTAVILSGFLLTACSHTASSSSKPSTNNVQRMHTSYYGKELAGRRTANGERFNPAAMTCAHRSLPFGTKLSLVNPKNGKTVVVRVNDRGPFIKGRHLDVSSGAAKALGFKQSGVATLHVVKVK